MPLAAGIRLRSFSLMFALLSSPKSRFLVVTLLTWLAIDGVLLAQADEFSIPGVDDPASVTSGNSGAAPDSIEEEGFEAPIYGNLLERLVRKGGLFIWPLFALSLVVLGLTVYCLIDLTKGRFYSDKVMKELRSAMEQGDVYQALERSQASPTCLGQVMAGATEFIGDRGYQVLDDSALFDAMADVSQEFNRGRARTINYFSVIAQAAPMVGLLGTVSGMIKAFDKLGQTGMGDPGSLAENISEALYTTASGLVIAVPALFLYFFFRDRLTHLIASTDREAYRLLNVLRRAIVARQNSQHEPPPAGDTGGSEPFVPTPHTPSS